MLASGTVAKRYTKKELQQPDEFVSFWGRAFNVVSAQGRPIAAGLAAGAILIGAAWAYAELSRSKEEKASVGLAHALKLYNAPVLPEGKEGKEAKELEPQLKALAEEGLPRFKTEKEKREAALKALDQMLAESGGTKTAREAELARAGVLYDLGRFDEALKAYADFLARTGAEERMRFLAREGRGYAFEAKGELDAALDEYRKLEADAPFYKDRASYDQARVLERKGQKAEAEALYKKIIERSPVTPLREEITNRLAELEGATPPAPAAPAPAPAPAPANGK
jgi:tetratricopeptide (TPR) repeat protein